MLSCLSCIFSIEEEILFTTLLSLFIDFMIMLLKINNISNKIKHRDSRKILLLSIKMRFCTLIIVNQRINIKTPFVKISFDLSDDFWFFDSLFVKGWKPLKTPKITIILNFTVFAEKLIFRLGIDVSMMWFINQTLWHLIQRHHWRVSTK